MFEGTVKAVRKTCLIMCYYTLPDWNFYDKAQKILKGPLVYEKMPINSGEKKGKRFTRLRISNIQYWNHL